jgi:hypothetical protein
MMHPVLVDGEYCIGHIIETAHGFVVYDRDDKMVDTFETAAEAIGALKEQRLADTDCPS